MMMIIIIIIIIIMITTQMNFQKLFLVQHFSCQETFSADKRWAVGIAH